MLAKFYNIIIGACALILTAHSGHSQTIADVLVDPNATGKTRTLYINLKNLSTSRTNVWRDKRILFGHQNTSFEGLGFIDPYGTSNQSDVENAVGAFPAVYGFDFNRRAFGTFVGVAPYAVYQQHLDRAYSRNGIVTFSWHAKNPVTSGNVFDTSGNPVVSILNGGSARSVYLGWLDDIATFVKQVDEPIIFRPLMEDNGSFFWWGTSNATPAQFRALWRLTVNHLRDNNNVHNLLYAYTPEAGNPDFYGANYPGDDYVDIIGGDIYGNGNFSSTILNKVRTMVNFANARGKVAALTEVGPRNGFFSSSAASNFYTSVLLNTIEADPTARKIAYIHVWRNANESPNNHWIPQPGHAAHPAFVSFFNDSSTVFSNNSFNMYQPMATAIQGFPYCISPSTVDPDGDGWGWELSKYSCIMPGGIADLSSGTATGIYQYCRSDQPLNDADGDGWGWQNSQSCVIPGSPPDPAANW
jgi:mannan endo-1,4-beta-mannosidase